IGDRLELIAAQGDGLASWTGLTPDRHERWRLEPVGLDLYSGLGGIAFFLGYLGDVCDERRYRALAQAALRMALRRAAEPDLHLGRHGISGLPGLVYAAAHLAALWEDRSILKEALRLAERVIAAIDADRDVHADVVSGLAGDIHCLATLHAATPEGLLKDGIQRAARRLVELAQPIGDGCGWIAPLEGVALAGMAHGAAGIVHALVRAATITGDRSLLSTAARAVRFERSLFDDARGVWRDVRPGADDSTPPLVAWCHGAAGIGLSRLAMLEVARGEDIDRDLRAALAGTLAVAPGANHSLCHGDLGNLELPFRVARTLGDASLAALVQQRLAVVLASIERDGVLSGAPYGSETPALMNGLAGSGLALLRFAEPDLVPSVLTLDVGRADFATGRTHLRARNAAARSFPPAATARALHDAIDAGRDFLQRAQRSDGCLRDFTMPPGFATTWTTAHACFVLDGVTELDELRQRAADYLVATVGADGWGYNRLSGADADSTSQALWTLHRCGRPVPRALVDCLARLQNDDGGFPTYGKSGTFTAEGWEVSHPDVTVIVAWVLGELGGADEARAQALRWLSRRLVDGVLPAYWWTTPAYALWAQARTVTFTDRIVEHARRLLAAQPTSPDVSHLIYAALRAGAEPASLDVHIERLLRLQSADGAWPSVPCMRLTAPHVKESKPDAAGDLYPGVSGVFATAHAVAALAARLR
ncbi:MAG: type 2 lantibiotic biosynthesis protein LanM, partial [bacterium]|nr:type 2 lantibiotic biosynthesis protein LanM [bacterium]